MRVSFIIGEILGGEVISSWGLPHHAPSGYGPAKALRGVDVAAARRGEKYAVVMGIHDESVAFVRSVMASRRSAILTHGRRPSRLTALRDDD